MKSLILALAANLSMASLAHAEAQCAFGESSWQLKEEMESDASGKLWYQGEHLDLTSPQRLKGLSQLEREMVLASYTIDGDSKTEKEQLLDFVSSDGYITYFTPNSDRRQFAMVASYPGDNEYGMVYEIRQGPVDALVAVPVAEIADGDFYECKVLKSEIK